MYLIYRICFICVSLILAACGDKQPVASNLEIENWGPKSTKAGQAFWPQGTAAPSPDEGSVMWLKLAGPPDPAQNYELKFGFSTITNMRKQGNMLVFSVPAAAYEVAGSKSLALTEVGSGRVAEFGPFVVKEPLE
jgi:hypothetical protein